jgi:iron complex outermembrane receptor protein
MAMKKALFLILLASGTCLSIPVAAQDAARPAPQGAQGDKASLDDIIVTANRTETLASKTPLAITAIGGAELARAGITTTSAIADVVPNIVLATVSGGLQVSIRGITTEEANERGDTSAAFLVDNVYIARPQAVEVGLFDIARIEVLRGPQGTLFGRNTTAGLIHVITNRPAYDAFSGSVDAEYGNYNQAIATGVVNISVGQDTAIRAAVNYERRDNYIERGPLFTGRIDPFKKNISARLQAAHRWSTGELILRGDYAHLGGRPFDHIALNSIFAPTVTGVDPAYLDRSTKDMLNVKAPTTLDQRRDNTSWGISGELNQELGPLDLTYVASYRKFDRFDTDSRQNAADTLAYRLLWEGSFRQQSHELRLAYGGNGPLKVQVGGYFFKEDISQDLYLLLVPNSDYLGTTVKQSTPLLQNRAYAVFGQGTYSLTDSLRVTAGIRYSVDKKDRPDAFNASCDRFDCSGTVTRTLTNSASAKFSKITWRAGVDYDLTPSLMLFGSVATGYKAGGFNDGCEIGTAAGCTLAADSLYFRPETITSYEGGLKGRLFDVVRFNLNAFHYDFTDIQLFQIIADCGGGASCSATTNAGKAKVDGVELDGSVAASRDDRFTFRVSYLNGRFTQFAPDATYNFAGRPLTKSPKWTLSAGYDHIFHLANGGEIQAGVRTTYTDEYFLLSVASRNYYRQPGYTRTDANITYTAPGERFYVTAFAKNLENSLPLTAVSFGARAIAQTQSPRTYGVRGGIKL